MAGKKDQPIIIKKIKKKGGHGGHHGGAWKIAYADFVTAMMAFFLLMWLLAVADKETKRGLADYFNNPPIRLSLMGGENVGEATRPIPGGGEDITKQEGERKRGDNAPSPITTKAAREAARAKEKQELEKLREEITAAIDAIPSLQQFKGQLLLDITSEGLRIQVVDQESRPMFDQGQANLKPYAQQILREISTLINATDNRISISGHTDSVGYSGGEAGYSNWELSNDRANAARRALIAGGLDHTRVMRVVGLADTVLLDKEKSDNPQNRRISIVVMNRDTEESISAGEGEAPDPAEEAAASEGSAEGATDAPAEDAAAEPAVPLIAPPAEPAAAPPAAPPRGAGTP